MKTTRTLLALVFAGASLSVCAADSATNAVSRAGEPPGGGRKPPEMPLFKALDANGDGVIDAAEIANAPAALKKLDKNGDGKLTRDEVMPNHQKGQGGPGGGGKPPAEGGGQGLPPPGGGKPPANE